MTGTEDHPTRSRRRSFDTSFILLGYSTQALAVGIFPLVLPALREDLAMTFEQAGRIALFSTLAYAVGQVPSALLVDRFGAIRMFAVSLLGVSLSTILLAYTTDYLSVLGDQVAIGFFRALAFTAGLTLIVQQYPKSLRATAMSYFFGVGFLAIAVLGVVCPVLIGRFGWQSASLQVGLAALLLGVVWACGHRGPAGQGRGRVHRARSRLSARAVLRRPVLLNGFVQFTRLAVATSLLFWLPTYLVDEVGLGLSAAGILIAVGNLGGLLGVIVGGVVADRVPQPAQVILGSLTMMCVCFVALALSREPVVAFVGVTIVGCLMQAYIAPLFELGLRDTGGLSAATMAGIGNTFANAGGLTFGYLLGLFREMTGSFALSWWSLCLLCAAAAIATRRLRA